ncbi:MAG: CRISPR-associated endonuclease Cas2 [Patescibacteria group bacterium]
MLKRESLEIAKLSAKEILLALFDATVMPFFEASPVYRKSAMAAKDEIENSKINLRQKIYYLKKHGYIESFTRDKEKYLEITPRGINHIKKIMTFDIRVKRSEIWDRKWRVVIFDIPEKMRDERDIFRKAIKNAGFIQIQKSVHVYPFECTREISELSERLGVSENVVIMISEIFQGEQNIIEEFIDRGILFKEDLISE